MERNNTWKEYNPEILPGRPAWKWSHIHQAPKIISKFSILILTQICRSRLKPIVPGHKKNVRAASTICKQGSSKEVLLVIKVILPVRDRPQKHAKMTATEAYTNVPDSGSLVIALLKTAAGRRAWILMINRNATVIVNKINGFLFLCRFNISVVAGISLGSVVSF